VNLNEYPNSVHLKVVVGGSLCMYLNMSEDSSEEFIKAKRQEALALFTKVVESRDPKHTPMALFFIAHINMLIENYEESEKALKELPQNLDPVTLYPYIYLKQGKTEEAIKLCSNKLLNYINNSCLILITLSNISQEEKNYEKTLFYLDACYRMQNIFKIGSLTPLAYKYAKLYIEIDDKEDAAKWFKIYVEGVISAEYDYHDNPYFEKVELEIKPEEQKIMKKNYWNQ
jgi:tetratricopeptide (TPR) repeat protein